MPDDIQPEGEITGPSSDPKPPVLTVGTIAAPVIRTGGQGIGGAFIVQGLQLFEVLDLTTDQAIWMTTALTVAISALQNWIEKRRGRRLVGAAV